MPDPLAALLAAAPPGDILIWLVPTAVLAGFIRGFTGFGMALVYVPVAARVLPPTEVVLSLLVMDMFAPLPLLRPALRAGNRPEVARLALGGIVGVPLGLWVLTRADPTVFRWIASLLALGLLAVLVSGVRMRAAPGPRTAVAVGGASGFMGGFSGMAGPPLILFYLGGAGTPATIRANIILFFAVLSVVSFVAFAARGLLDMGTVVLGLTLAVPYTLAILIGMRIFRLCGDALFRWAAYGLVGIAALSGLPIFQ